LTFLTESKEISFGLVTVDNCFLEVLDELLRSLRLLCEDLLPKSLSMIICGLFLTVLGSSFFKLLFLESDGILLTELSPLTVEFEVCFS
jgi:hypothetical protein